MNGAPKLRMNGAPKLRMNGAPKLRMNRAPKLRMNRAPEPRMNRAPKMYIAGLHRFCQCTMLWKSVELSKPLNSVSDAAK
jgi:hypothetical protein